MFPEYTSKFPELGFYGLPGHTRSPKDILRQAQDAEAMGLGNIMISERADYKEIAGICGAVAAVTSELFIGTSGTNLNKRHPTVTASIGSTLNRLSEGRFALGLAKGNKQGFRRMGLPYPTFAHEREFVDVLRRLWRGEAITNYDGVLGKFDVLSVAPYLDEDIPILYVGFGPKTLENAGQLYDGAHLHTFMSPNASPVISTVVTHPCHLDRSGEIFSGMRPTCRRSLCCGRDDASLDLKKRRLLQKDGASVR